MNLYAVDRLIWMWINVDAEDVLTWVQDIGLDTEDGLLCIQRWVLMRIN